MTKRTRGASPGKENTDTIALMLQIVTLLAGIIALLAAISQGRPASVIALLVAAAAGIGFVLMHVWRTRLRSGAYRYGWQRWTTLAIAASSALFLGVVSLVPGSREIFIYDVLGFHHTDKPDELIIAEGQGYYCIQIPVHNNQSRDDQLDSVTVTVDWNANVGIECLSGSTEYRLSDHITIGTGGKFLQARVRPLSGSLSGFSLPATGTLGGYCASGSLSFTFNPGLIIEANSTALLYVDVPEHIKATYLRETSPYGDVTTKRGDITADATGIPDPINEGGYFLYSFVRIKSQVKSISGATYSSCELEEGPLLESAMPALDIKQIVGDCHVA